MAALVVCLSTQLFCDLASDAPQPLVVAILGSTGGEPETLVLRLLHHYMEQKPHPKEQIGILRSIGSAAGFMLLLPWQVRQGVGRGRKRVGRLLACGGCNFAGLGDGTPPADRR